MRSFLRGILLLSAIFFPLSGCGTIHFPLHAGSESESRQAAPAGSPASIPPKPKASLEPDIRRNLETADYETALKLLRRETRGGRPEAALAGDYGRAINGLLAKAEFYLKQGLPEKAGELYRTAHDAFPATGVAAKEVELTSSEIEARLGECAGQLLERGLVAYRAGDLDGAIRTWKLIQSFAPHHQASMKALKTAEVQRMNLEKVGARK